jgi:hypothetical protein
VKLVEISGRKKEYMKPNLMEMKITARPRISETCIGASMILREVSSLEIIE